MKQKKENLKLYDKIFGPGTSTAIRTGKIKVTSDPKDLKSSAVKGGLAGALIGGTAGTIMTGNPVGGIVAGGLIGATKGALVGPELSSAAAVKIHRLAKSFSKKNKKSKT